jgi:hypothetical protein
MSVTAGEAGQVSAAWLSVSEAAMACRVSERTVRRWVSDGVVESRMETAGLRESRLILRGSLPASSLTDRECQATAAPSDMLRQDAAGHGVEGPGINEPTPALSELATVTQRADAAERERDRAEREVEFLRSQLDLRSLEIQRRDQAEVELRRLLLAAQQTAQTLAAQLEQKTLPPHNVTEVKRRIRWAWWRR